MPKTGRQIKHKTELQHVEEIRDKLDELAARSGRTRYSVGMDLVRNLEDEIQAILMAIVLDDFIGNVETITARIMKKYDEESADTSKDQPVRSA